MTVSGLAVFFLVKGKDTASLKTAMQCHSFAR